MHGAPPGMQTSGALCKSPDAGCTTRIATGGGAGAGLAIGWDRSTRGGTGWWESTELVPQRWRSRPPQLPLPPSTAPAVSALPHCQLSRWPRWGAVSCCQWVASGQRTGDGCTQDRGPQGRSAVTGRLPPPSVIECGWLAAARLLLLAPGLTTTEAEDTPIGRHRAALLRNGLIVLQDALDEEPARVVHVLVLLCTGLKPIDESVILAELVHLCLRPGDPIGEVALIGQQNTGDRGVVRQIDLVINIILPLGGRL
mmetsp:Transcript_130829/g.226393  ORF Transcript_130829/g.226393 Transcript_130829/m.226393 type:complete len:255 (+) Transcript_130829:46-810(+)